MGRRGAAGRYGTGRDDVAACPELACVHGLVPEDALEWAALRAERLGDGADRSLIAGGLIGEEAYLRALSRHTGIAFEPLEQVTRNDCPLPDKELLARTAGGLLPLNGRDGRPGAVVVAPRGLMVRALIEFSRRDPARTTHVRLTTTERLNRFVLQAGGQALTRAATEHLGARWPLLSAKARRYGRGLAVTGGLAAAMLMMAAGLAPAAASVAATAALSAMFMTWIALRLTGAMLGEPIAPRAPPLPDRALPDYTVIAALYREASSVPDLLGAISRFDYPAEKLDVIVAVEADDHDTRAALNAAAKRCPVTIITVPPHGPRTKPKALNVALPFARGAYTVVYDAEDRPEPDQLRRALQGFLDGPRNLACVQARLCIDNTGDGWLAGCHTAEYAGQFDVFMPGLARLGLPLPLGGSSNHFHTATLRRIGGWDPFNVTEDADLGMRLARFGYRTGMIASTTYEEAPARSMPWLRQRTRWFKGWMQTYMVHMRQPCVLCRELGPFGFVTFQLMIGGNVLSALVHPVFLAVLAASLLTDDGGDGSLTALGALSAATALGGYLSSAAIGWWGLSRRGLRASAWVLALTPLHWLFLSAAAWRALYQLFAAPFVWEKTEHGLARSSHRTARLTAALTDLDRDLGAVIDDGKLPTINAPPQRATTDTSADPPPPLAASA